MTPEAVLHASDAAFHGFMAGWSIETSYLKAMEIYHDAPDEFAVSVDEYSDIADYTIELLYTEDDTPIADRVTAKFVKGN